MAMQFKKFVADFLDEKKTGICAMDVIYSLWLINMNLVYWPNHLQLARLKAAIGEAVMTPENNWKQLKMRILHSFGYFHFFSLLLVIVITYHYSVGATLLMCIDNYFFYLYFFGFLF